METPKQIYTKLVRDKIPEIMDKAGAPYDKRIASPEEREAFLIEKLIEEFREFKEAQSPEELADILEVVIELRKLPKFADVEAVRQKKFDERGVFEQGIILTGEK